MYDLSQNEPPLLYWFSKVGDFFGLSVLWLLLCIPLVTSVPASIALYDAVAHCIHGREDGTFKRFFKTLKKELLKGMLLSVVWLSLAFLLTWGYNILYQYGKESQIAAVYSLVYLLTMLIPLGIYTWVIPVQSRFEHTFFSLHKAAAAYAISHLPTTIVLLLLVAVAVIIIPLCPVLILLLPAIVVTLQSWFIERVFKKYIPEEKDTEEADA